MLIGLVGVAISGHFNFTFLVLSVVMVGTASSFGERYGVCT